MESALCHACYELQCSLGSQKECTLCTSSTLFSLVLLSMIGIVYILSLAKSYKMTFRRQEKSLKVNFDEQSHLRNPQAAKNGFMLLS